jgi:two-component system cell cycle sensor histidine kinase/response regulator CckA
MILRVLVVDDEEPMRLFVGRVLQDAGHEVAMAVNGDDAIAMLPALTGLDVLVTDEVMPRMPGHELARLVRAREPAVRVLYLTGFSDQLFKEKRAMWAGEAFLEKPCSAKALLEAVSQLLRGDLETDS